MIEVDKMGIMMLKKFVKYVSQNMLGMVGMSVYILADTYFISVAVGTDGITALNLVLPVYNMIFAIGAMMGVGSAIRLVIERNQEHPNADGYFFHALSWALIVGLLFILVGIFFPDKLIALLGGDAEIVAVGKIIRVFLWVLRRFLCGIISAMLLCATMGIHRSQWLRHYSAVCSILYLTMY